MHKQLIGIPGEIASISEIVPSGNIFSVSHGVLLEKKP